MRAVDRKRFSEHLMNSSVRLSVKRGQTLEYWAGDTLVGIKVNGMHLINKHRVPRKRDYLP